MEFTQIAGTNCGERDCPAVFRTDRGTIAVQGDIVERQTAVGEGVVEIPTDILKEAVRALGW
jgi:hypothetical protein